MMGTQSKELADARKKWLFAKKMTMRAYSEGRFNTIYETSMRIHRNDYLRLRQVWNEPAAALAAAEAEVARLRAALDKASLIAAEGRYWANQSGSRHRFDEIMKLASGALFAVQTLNPEATHENG
jgi:hypothetical protein